MADLSKLNQVLEAAKKLPGQTLGGPVDISNLIMGLATGKGLKGFVDKPTGGSESINEKFGLGKSTGSTEDIASMLMSLATPGGATKAAMAGMIVPAQLLKDFKTFNSAKKALATGEDAEKVYGTSGIFKLPKDDVLRVVISDEKAAIKDSDIFKRTLPMASHKGPTQLIHTALGSDKTLGDILDHPELFAAMPELKDIKVKGKFADYAGGAYSKDADTIYMGAQDSMEKLKSVLLHEVQHGIQGKSGMVFGAGPGDFIKDSNAIKEAAKKIQEQKKVSDQFMKLNPSAIETKVNKTLGDESKALQKVDADAYQTYKSVQGEAEARLVQKQLETGDYRTYPPKLLDVDLDKLTDPKYAPFVDENPIIQQILKDYKAK